MSTLAFDTHEAVKTLTHAGAEEALAEAVVTTVSGMNPLVHKIHVPMETSSRATITVDGATFHLEAGSAYEINNLAPHGAFNGGAEDRIHFIFEVFDGTGMVWRQRRLGHAHAPLTRSTEVGGQSSPVAT